MHDFSILSIDHLDLLATAADRYRLLVPPTVAAFSDVTAGTGLVASPAEAGELLRDEYVAALRWTAARGRLILDLPSDLLHYRHRPVELVDPLEVVKAAHCFEALAGASPGWSGSAARVLVDAVVRAATRRIPGYDLAPSRWTRPGHRRLDVVGLAKAWTPLEAGVTWLTPADLEQRWESASHVLVTVDAIAHLPGGLAPHPEGYLLARGPVTPDVLAAAQQCPLAALVMCPLGLPWLRSRIGQAAS